MSFSDRPRPARYPGKCRRCGGWIPTNSPVLLAPFRHPGCTAWAKREIANLAASLGIAMDAALAGEGSPASGPYNGATGGSEPLAPAQPARPPTAAIRPPGPEPAAIHDQLAALASRLLAIDAQHDGYVKWNPGKHAADCQRLCADRRRLIEIEMDELQARLALSVIAREEVR